MAAIQDVSNIFVGRTLEIFNELERVVGRDGDVAYAQQAMSDHMLQVISSTPVSGTTSAGAVKHRA